jgi:chromosome segregation ATPase
VRQRLLESEACNESLKTFIANEALRLLENSRDISNEQAITDSKISSTPNSLSSIPQVSMLTCSVNETKELVRMQRAQVNDLNLQLQSQNQSITLSDRQNLTLRKEREILDNELKESKLLLSKHEKELNSVKFQNTYSEEDFAFLLKKQNTKHLVKLEKLKSTIKSKDLKISELSNAINELLAKTADLECSKRIISAAHDAAVDHTEELQEEIGKCNDRITELEESNLSLMIELDKERSYNYEAAKLADDFKIKFK